jgi:endonuclease/exonuclease/phosphatase family metal-dependent hydrolase
MSGDRKWGGVVAGVLVVALVAGLAIARLVSVASLAMMVPTAVDRCQGSGLGSGGLISTSEGVRVMSFNIHTASMTAKASGMGDHAADFLWSTRAPQIANMVTNVDPDLIGLQEAGVDRVTHRHQLEALSGSLSGYTWVFGDTAIPMGIRSSAFQVIDKGKIRLNWKGKDSATQNRWAVWAKLQASDGSTLFLVNLHAQYMQTDAAARARSAGWSRLVAAMAKANPGDAIPMVVVGDFNARSDETRPVYRAHLDKLSAAGWVDATSSSTQYSEVSRVTSYNGWGDTINGKWYYKAINRGGSGSNHIDYVWTAGGASSPAWQVYTGPTVSWRPVGDRSVPFAEVMPSDHWPIVAQVVINSSASTVPVPTTLSVEIPTSSAKVDGYSSEQMKIAGQIVAAGKSLGLDTWTLTVGVMTAMGESSLRNIDYGDKAGPDSRGIFQQRTGWGSLEDRMNPYKASLAFFKALVKVPGYRSLAPTIAAHRTQRNADPNHYAKYWDDAVKITAAVANDPSLLTNSGDGDQADCDPGFSTGPLPGFSGICPPSGSAAESGLQATALQGLRCVKATFPQIKRMGGKGSRPIGTSDHPAGLAVDFMIDRWNTTEGNAFGWQVAHWVQANAKALHVKYIIFDAKKWNPEVNNQWRPYTHPLGNTSPTLAHRDHVHVSFTGS